MQPCRIRYARTGIEATGCLSAHNEDMKDKKCSDYGTQHAFHSSQLINMAMSLSFETPYLIHSH